MKKISALLFIILGLPILAANFIISGGASLQRKVDISVNEVVLVTQENIDNSYDIGFEAFFPITEKFEWGTGIRFQPTFISNDLEVIGFILSVLEIILNNANPAFSKASFKLFPYA